MQWAYEGVWSCRSESDWSEMPRNRLSYSCYREKSGWTLTDLPAWFEAQPRTPRLFMQFESSTKFTFYDFLGWVFCRIVENLEQKAIRPAPPPSCSLTHAGVTAPCSHAYVKCCFLAKRNYLYNKHRRDLLKNVAYVQQNTADLMHERRIAVDIQETVEAISHCSSQETVELFRRLAAISQTVSQSDLLK